MGMASGGHDLYFGTDVAPIFMEHSNVGDKHENNFDPLTLPASWPSSAGPSICHLSPVTRGGGGGSGTCFNFHSGRGGDPSPPWTPSPPPLDPPPPLPPPPPPPAQASPWGGGQQEGDH